MDQIIICMEEGKYYKHTNTYKRDEVPAISNSLVCAAAVAILIIIGLIQYSATIILADDECIT